MKMPVATPVVVAAALALAVAAPAADLTVVSKTTSKDGAGTSTQYLTSDWMRNTEGDSDMLYDLAAGRIVTIDHSRKQYSEMTLAEVEAAMAAANAQMKQASAELQNLPAAMRERMGQLMGGGEVTLTKGGTRKIAGYTAQQHTITRGDSMTMEVWTTTELELPVAVEKLREVAGLGGSMAAMANPMLQGMSELAEKMKEVRGFPLASSNSFSIMGHETTSSREAVEVKTGAIPASTFDLAAIAPGYKKVPSALSKR